MGENLNVVWAKFSRYSDICTKRHLRERHLREVRGKGTKLGEGERH
jgi:hypothetical protein